MKAIKLFFSIAVSSALLSSCTKYQEIGAATFSDQQIYMPAAVEGNATNGIYSINKVAVPGQVFRYTADVAGKKLNVLLAAYRSGATTTGAVNVTVALNTDTANRVLALGRFPVGTEILTLGKFNIPSTITIADGADYAGFTFSIDLDFLLANLTKKYAIGVGVSSEDRKTSLYGTTVLLIDPSFLVPAASFTTSVSTRTVSFSNTSLNAATYIWNYGDGTALSTDKAGPHIYTAPGTYTITLTAVGALGDFNKSVYTSTVVIP